MPLSEAQKHKIEEEEKYRAKVRNKLVEINEPETNQPKKKSHGCLWALTVIFIILPVAIAFFPLTLGIVIAKYAQGFNINPKLKAGIAVIALAGGLLLTANLYSRNSINLENNQIVRVDKSETTIKAINEELGYKIRHIKSSQGERYIIQGQEIRIGETWDSVAEKLGKTAVKTKVAQDPEFGQVVEHQYEKYSILVAREPQEKNYYVVWDIYPNSQ